MANPITITTPLPRADLFFESLSPGLNPLGEMQLSLLSEKSTLAPADSVGQLVAVNPKMKDGSKWHFNGYVKRFGVGRHRGRYHDRRATVMRGMSSTTASCRSVPMRA